MCVVCRKQEARVLMNNKADMTIDDLREVLLENELTNFDPVAEAFKVRCVESVIIVHTTGI